MARRKKATTTTKLGAYLDTSEHKKVGDFDPTDRALPKQLGFVTDYVYHLRGIEAPTLFSIWGSLHMIASIVKREAWMNWFPDPRIYTHMYVLLVGLPASGKSTVVLSTQRILRPFGSRQPSMMPNVLPGVFKRLKHISMYENKATPEGLLKLLQPSSKPQWVKYKIDGEDETNLYVPNSYNRTSEVILSLSELSVMLGKQAYNEGMIPILLDLWDPRDIWEYSKSQETLKLRHTLVNFFAATTPDGFRSATPSAAVGDGFMSRLTIVNLEETTRIKPWPSIPKNAPTESDLTERLAYIGMNAMGEYHLTKDGKKWYEEWYFRYRKRMNENPDEQAFLSRFRSMLPKIALLMHFQRYAEISEREVTVEDLMDADRLLNYTYSTVPSLVSEVTGDSYNRLQNRMFNAIKRHKLVQRRKLMKDMKVQVSWFDEALKMLILTEAVYVYRAGERRPMFSTDGAECYSTEEIETNK